MSDSRPVRRRAALAAALVAASLPFLFMRTRLLNALLYFPYRTLEGTPSALGLAFKDVAIETEDGERLHGWFIPARERPARGHVLHFHGNAGNISYRLTEAEVLANAGLDVFLFDYRGYGRSTGSPSEEGTYRDARAARTSLLSQPGVDAGRVVYLGESLGGGVALALALEAPPGGLVLRSTFTSVRDLARLHYPFVPRAYVPDAYPSLARIGRLRSPLLVFHGDRDDIVPLSHGQALFAAAPDPKRFELVRGAGHNDFLGLAGRSYGRIIGEWVAGLGRDPGR